MAHLLFRVQVQSFASPFRRFLMGSLTLCLNQCMWLISVELRQVAYVCQELHVFSIMYRLNLSLNRWIIFKNKSRLFESDFVTLKYTFVPFNFQEQHRNVCVSECDTSGQRKHGTTQPSCFRRTPSSAEVSHTHTCSQSLFFSDQF